MRFATLVIVFRLTTAATALTVRRTATTTKDSAPPTYESFREAAMKLEGTLFGCEGGGIRRDFINDADSTRQCNIFHAISKNLDNDDYATITDAVRPFYDQACDCQRSKCTDTELYELSLAAAELDEFVAKTRNMPAAIQASFTPVIEIGRAALDQQTKKCDQMATIQCDCIKRCVCERSQCSTSELQTLAAGEAQVKTLRTQVAAQTNEATKQQLNIVLQSFSTAIEVAKATCDVMIPFDGCDCELVSDLRANYGCGGGDIDCFTALANEIETVERLYNEFTSITQECSTDTYAIEDEIKTKYDADAMTQDVITRGEDEPVTFVEFDPNPEYEIACVAKGGIANTLSYSAICDEINSSTKQTVRTVNLVVVKQARCFASSCEEKDRAGLLQSFALAETEERNAHDNMFWLCVGQETEDGGLIGSHGSENACDFQTVAMSTQLDLEIAERSVQADFTTKKWPSWFGILETQTKIVDFTDAGMQENYKTTCSTTGGVFSELDENQIVTCGEQNFEVVKFGACLGGICENKTEAVLEPAMASMFMKKVKDSKELDGSFSCVVSGSRILTIGTTVSMAVLATFWQWYLVF
mmetsp:Transcript_3935/g.6580  ORF Transcript_3935/g.6580 Transcript_3935/m.6580 type:complete len:587 (+) Transcript_3935:97-1857(+)|eukprot:CAMPEP_0119022860 /NCGR_PEP_ID=MMETSP1176-20130426/28855_1 /TAXON_ID=265551 /ORGANISM="Synedropsis recta cf, Strain CCMP1620" /LENGTH=586 /DNA_ID=CAMNT_0006977807 /DNA_START=91 /DNA_END=1851 /DNA_ORIENTATION=-